MSSKYYLTIEIGTILPVHTYVRERKDIAGRNCREDLNRDQGLLFAHTKKALLLVHNFGISYQH